VRLLLDTHVFLWLNSVPERLGHHLDLMRNEETELLLSAASAWEIAIKVGVGRLSLPQPPERYVPARLRAIGGRSLPVEQEHALAVATLPELHRDPFDRLLVAQSLHVDATLVTADPAVVAYGAPTLDVG